MKPSGKDVTTKKADGATTKKPTDAKPTTKAPGKSKAKKLGGGKKKKMCKAVIPEKPNCNTTQHGCCPDGTTVAKGPFGAGKNKNNNHSNSEKILFVSETPIKELTF